MHWLAFLFFLWCTTARAEPAGAEYLPRSALADDQWTHMEDWIGSQLRAMDEPSLLAQSKTQPTLRTFRLFVAPTFRPAYAVRVIERREGSGEAVFVVLNGQGGYEPGNIQRRSTRRVSRSRMARLRKAFMAANFWNLAVEPQNPGRVDPHDPEQIICVDGTLFVFEAVTDGNYHVVIPDHCPDLPQPFYDLASAFNINAWLGR
jgi:hypothetical protein